MSDKKDKLWIDPDSARLTGCPRCSGRPVPKLVYGIHVLQCGTLACGAVVTGKTADEVVNKWNARAPTATIDQCRHCAGDIEQFEFCFAGIFTCGYTCKSCGCSTGGRSWEQALKLHQRGFHA